MANHDDLLQLLNFVTLTDPEAIALGRAWRPLGRRAVGVGRRSGNKPELERPTTATIAPAGESSASGFPLP